MRRIGKWSIPYGENGKRAFSAEEPIAGRRLGLETGGMFCAKSGRWQPWMSALESNSSVRLRLPMAKIPSVRGLRHKSRASGSDSLQTVFQPRPDISPMRSRSTAPLLFFRCAFLLFTAPNTLFADESNFLVTPNWHRVIHHGWSCFPFQTALSIFLLGP